VAIKRPTARVAVQVNPVTGESRSLKAIRKSATGTTNEDMPKI
jgi:hypothetical protein